MKTMLRALPGLVAALLALAPSLAAQDTPEQVVARYFDTFRSGDYAGNVALMHPDALDELKETMGGLVALAGTEDEEFREMFGVASMEEFNRLSSAQMFERMLRWQLDQPEMRELLSSARTVVLGHVMEGDTTAHVVYRMRMGVGELTVDQVQVAPVKRAGGEWRVLLTGSFAGMINAVPRAERGPE
jgi:ketosteroid isomerase-like protein